MLLSDSSRVTALPVLSVNEGFFPLGGARPCLQGSGRLYELIKRLFHKAHGLQLVTAPKLEWSFPEPPSGGAGGHAHCAWGWDVTKRSCCPACDTRVTVEAG